MSKTKQVQIRCQQCGNWFNSPIFFGVDESFDTSMLEDNEIECPHCGVMTGCDKENMRVIFENGGFRGKDTF